MLGQNGDVLVVDVHAVRGDRRHVESAQRLEPLDRRLSVMALAATFDLRLRLGNVHVHARVVFLRPVEDGFRGHVVVRVFGVDAALELDTAVSHAVDVVDAVFHLGEHGELLDGLRLERERRRAQVRLHAQLVDRTGALGRVVVHVGEADNAVAQHLGAGQKRGPVVVLGDHLAFERPALRLEPCLQRKVLGIAAQKRHRRVRMGVVERRHEQTSFALVHLAVVDGVGRLFPTDVVDRAVQHAHPLVLLVVEVLVNDCNVLEQHRAVSFRFDNDHYRTMSSIQARECPFPVPD